MNILLSRILSTLKRTNALYPLLPNNPKSKQFSETVRSAKFYSTNEKAFSEELKLSKDKALSLQTESGLQALEDFLKVNFHIHTSKIDPVLSKQIHYLLQIAQCFLDYLYFKTEGPIEILIKISLLSKHLEHSFLALDKAKQSNSGSKSSLGTTQRELQKSIQKDIRTLNLDLQKSVGTAINSVMTLQILKELQDAYEKAIKNPNPSPANETQEVFWLRLTRYLFKFINQSHLTLLEKHNLFLGLFSTHHLVLDVKNSLMTKNKGTHQLPSRNFYAEQLTAKLIFYIRRAIFIFNFTEKHGAECLRLFSKHHHPASGLSSFCVGTGASWALDMIRNPTLNRKPNPTTLQYIEFLKSLKAETLPTQFLSTKAWLGDSILTEESLNWQLYFTHAFENEKPDFSSSADQKVMFEATAVSAAETNPCSGEALAKAVVYLFEKNNSKAPVVSGVQVSIMTATLATFNQKGQYLLHGAFRPHMLWFAKLTVEDPATQKTKYVYHVFDDALGEIKFNSEKSLSGWLQDYFDADYLGSFSWDTTCKYSRIFNHFTLNIRDQALHAVANAKANSIGAPLIHNKNIFQLLQERVSTHQHQHQHQHRQSERCAMAATVAFANPTAVLKNPAASVNATATANPNAVSARPRPSPKIYLARPTSAAKSLVARSVKGRPVWNTAGTITMKCVSRTTKPQTATAAADKATDKQSLLFSKYKSTAANPSVNLKGASKKISSRTKSNV